MLVDDPNLTKTTVSMIRLYSPNPPQQQAAAGPSGIRRSNSNISTESDASSVASWILDNQSSPMKYSKLDPIVAIDFSTASTTMEIDHQSESSFHSCSEASAGEISASRISIDSSDDEERRSTSSRVTRSSTRNVTPVKKPPSNLSARKLKFKRKSRDKNIARASRRSQTNEENCQKNRV
jgi:hypothetical protein